MGHTSLFLALGHHLQTRFLIMLESLGTFDLNSPTKLLNLNSACFQIWGLCYPTQLVDGISHMFVN